MRRTGITHDEPHFTASALGCGASPFEPFDRQSLNRYAYVRNAPLDFVDPSGFQLRDGGCMNSGCTPATPYDSGEWTDGTEYGTDYGGTKESGSDGGGRTGGGNGFGTGGGPGGGGVTGGGPGGAMAGGPGPDQGGIPDFAGPNVDATPWDGGTWEGGKRGGNAGNGLAVVDCKSKQCGTEIAIPGPGVVVGGGKAGAGVLVRLLIKLFGKGAEKAAPGAAKAAAEVADDAAKALTGGGTGAARAVVGASDVKAIIQGLAPGKNRGVWLVNSLAELEALFARLSSSGKAIANSKYGGKLFELADKTTVGLRSTSKSGGAAIDIATPEGAIWKVHIQ